MNDLPIVGFLEQATLPNLSQTPFEAKIDTGAATSSLHATDLTFETADGAERVTFTTTLDPDGTPTRVETPVVDRRRVRSSNGTATERVVIGTTLRLAGIERDIQVTLADRSSMQYPLIVGREALAGQWLVDTGATRLHG